MKVRGLNELEDLLDKDLSWRKQELTTSRFTVLRATRAHEREVLLRGALCLLYAHWEGFMKRAVQAYVAYVQSRDLPFLSLKDCFVAMHLAREIQQCGRTTRRWPAPYEKLIAQVASPNGTKFIVPPDVVDTESNLDSAVLTQLLLMVGISLDSLQAKIVLPIVDRDLVDKRNAIAHGDRVSVADFEYEQLHGRVIGWMSLVHGEILNAAAQKNYLR